MADKLKVLQPNVLIFICPACKIQHFIFVGPNQREWNGSLDNPTVSKVRAVFDGGATRCNFTITDGVISYTSESTHTLAGQSVNLPDWGS